MPKRIFMIKKLNLIAVLISLFVLSGCSNGKDEEKSLLRRVPADADIAAVVNLKKVVESADGKLDVSKLVLPQYIKDSASKKFIELPGKIAESGINFESAAIWVNAKQKEPYIVFEFKDDWRVITAWLENNGYEKTSNIRDFQIFKTEDGNGSYSHCIFGQGFAYFYGHDIADDKAVSEIIAAAAKPIIKTEYGQYIDEGNVLGVAIKIGSIVNEQLPGFYNDEGVNRLCIKADLEKDKLEGKAVILDEKGEKVIFNPYNTSFNSAAVISSDALAYIPPSEQLVYGMALKDVDWDSAMSAITNKADIPIYYTMMLGVAKSYLEKLDGTVAIGIGFDGNREDLVNISNFTDAINYFPITVVAEIKPGKAKGMLGDLQAILGTLGMSPASTADGFAAHIPSGGMLYGSVIKNTIVLSTRPIEKYNSNHAAKLIDGYFAGYGIYLPDNAPYAAGMGIKGNLSASFVSDMKENEGEFEVKITDAEGHFVERLLRLVEAYHVGFEQVERQSALRSNFTPDI